MPKLERKLAIRSIEERDKLIEDNIKLVDKFLYDNHFSENAIPDYRGAAYLGLIRAAESYDNSINIAFSTYAYVCIEREVAHEKIHRRMDIPEYAIVSIDKPISFDEVNTSSTLKDIIANCTERVDEIVSTLDIRKIYHKLPNREREIALKKMQGYTFEEIGDELKVSRKRIQQIYKKFQDKVGAYIRNEA